LLALPIGGGCKVQKKWLTVETTVWIEMRKLQRGRGLDELQRRSPVGEA